MSAGHLRGEERSPAELRKILAEGDTAKLLAQPVKVDCSHDIPDLGGISVDRRTVYLDRKFVEDLKAGKIHVPGMTWPQVMACIGRHEHVEKSIIDGDNPIETYLPAHELATVAEHEKVPDPARYEAALKPAIKRAEHEDPKNPPRDLWCGPYLDDPDADDKRQLRIFRAKGVMDAFKVSKVSVSYRMARMATKPDVCCIKCSMWERDTVQDGGALAQCEIVSGLVRKDRLCDRFEARK